LSGSASLTTSATPPVTPKAGDMWFDSVGGQLYIYFNDGNSLQWVIANNFNGGLYLPLTGGTLSGPLIAPGVTDGSNAAAGQIGEYLIAALASTSAISLVSATQANVVTLALSAGDWDVRGTITLSGASANIVNAQLGISSTSATLPVAGSFGLFGMSGVAMSTLTAPLGVVRVSLSAGAICYLVAYAGFSGAVTAYGTIAARRVR
jgi:hypothetical protein